MASFSSTIELRASPEAVWAFIVDHGSEIESLSFTPTAEQGVGTLNELRGRIAFVIPIRGVSRTVEWDPPRRCVFESVKPSWPIRARITETFQPSTSGTRHSIDYEVTAIGLIGKVVAPVVCSLMHRSRRTFQARLGDALAARDSP